MVLKKTVKLFIASLKTFHVSPLTVIIEYFLEATPSLLRALMTGAILFIVVGPKYLTQRSAGINASVKE